MNNLTEKENIETPKKHISKTVKAVICIALCLVIAITACVVAFTKNSPDVCSYDDFYEAVVLVSEKLDCDSLWNLKECKDILYYNDSTLYSVPLNIEEATFNIAFYNNGDTIIASIENITADNMKSATQIAICITDSVYANYLTDIEDFITDNSTYPFIKSDYTYKNYIAEMFDIPDELSELEQNGAKFTSQGKQAEVDGIVTCYELRTKEIGDETYYDMTFIYYKQ